MTPDPADLARAAAVLAAGGMVVVPTDTVYGICVVADRTGSTQRLFTVKQRPAEVAVPVLVADVAQALTLVAPVGAVARRLMARFWPGGLTLVLPRRAGLDLDLGGREDGTIAVRLPAHEVPVHLAGLVGPLATTSANLHGRPTPTTALEAAAQLGDHVDFVLDGGACQGSPSTVAMCRDDSVRILRDGAIPGADVLSVAFPPAGIHQSKGATA